MVSIDAIVLGGGQGSRFSDKKTTLPKQFHLLDGKPVFVHALMRLESLGCIRNYIFAVPETFIETAHEQASKYLPEVIFKRLKIITGGNRRQDSSRLALLSLEGENSPERVLIHDACRPMLSEKLINTIREKLMDRSYGAWIPVVPVVETLKKISNDEVIETVDRNMVHRVQTPQIFEFTVLQSLMDRAKDQTQLNFTDDASLCEYYGIPVGSFPGDVRNIKLTFDFEMEIFRQILSEETKENA